MNNHPNHLEHLEHSSGAWRFPYPPPSPHYVWIRDNKVLLYLDGTWKPINVASDMVDSLVNLIESKQPKGNYAYADDVPKTISDLVNDLHYVTKDEIKNLVSTSDSSKKLSNLENDTGYITRQDLMQIVYSKENVDAKVGNISNSLEYHILNLIDDKYVKSPIKTINGKDLLGEGNIEIYEFNKEEDLKELNNRIGAIESLTWLVY